MTEDTAAMAEIPGKAPPSGAADHFPKAPPSGAADHFPKAPPSGAADHFHIPTTILVAPDSFKGTFSAVDVAEAIGRGLRARGRPIDLCPVADGGEGTLDALLAALDGERRTTPATDPLGRPVEAAFGIGEGARGRVIGIVEMAAASGLGLVEESERDAVQASTFGTGELILAAIEAGAQDVYLGVGGSATTDGGAGAIRAIREGGGLGDARIIVLTDVRTPFEQAARVFGPQKGADTATVSRLTKRLHEQARGMKRDPRGVPMTGAAGGLSGGLWAEFAAELVPGAQFVLDAVDFDRRMRAARAVVTGEGKLDQQSLAGKLVSEIATRARQSGVPCHAIVGTRELDSFGVRVLDLQAVFEASTTRQISAAARRLADVL
jgi:glycerate 2-kinase